MLRNWSTFFSPHALTNWNSLWRLFLSLLVWHGQKKRKRQCVKRHKFKLNQWRRSHMISSQPQAHVLWSSGLKNLEKKDVYIDFFKIATGARSSHFSYTLPQNKKLITKRFYSSKWNIFTFAWDINHWSVSHHCCCWTHCNCNVSVIYHCPGVLMSLSAQHFDGSDKTRW